MIFFVKAILCAVRIIRKVPEQYDVFQNSVRSLLTEKNHGLFLTFSYFSHLNKSIYSGVLLTVTSLITEMCQQNAQALHMFRKVSIFPSFLSFHIRLIFH